MKREKSNYTIQSVSHALDILESFTRAESELGVTELSKRLGLHKNNVFRLLATLEHRGYIEQNKASDSYRLGPRTLQIGSIFIAQRECRRQARPFLERLAGQTGETAVVGVLRGDKVVYMDSVETARSVRVVSRTGALFPAHCTATGKVQLAFLPAGEVERLYPEEGLSALTGRSIATRAALSAELRVTAERGWAFENEEADLDVRGIAAPVKDFSGGVVAAVGIIAPAARLAAEAIEKNGMIPPLLEACRSLSQALGFGGGLAKR